MPTCQIRQQSKLKTIEHASNCDALIIPCYFNISHSYTCPKTWEKELKWVKILENSVFVGKSTPPCWPRLQSKIKPVGHPTAYNTLII